MNRGVGGQPQGPPGQRVVQLTAEEMDGISQLTNMGFTQDQAVRAYIATGRNLEMAASLLFSDSDAFAAQPPAQTQVQAPAQAQAPAQSNGNGNEQQAQGDNNAQGDSSAMDT